MDSGAELEKEENQRTYGALSFDIQCGYVPSLDGDRGLAGLEDSSSKRREGGTIGCALADPKTPFPVAEAGAWSGLNPRGKKRGGLTAPLESESSRSSSRFPLRHLSQDSL